MRTPGLRPPRSSETAARSGREFFPGHYGFVCVSSSPIIDAVVPSTWRGGVPSPRRRHNPSDQSVFR